MALAAVKTKPLEIDEAVEIIWQEVVSGRADTASDAVRALWPIALTEEAATEVMITGMAQYANRQQAMGRRSGKTIAFGRPHGRAWGPYMATLSTPYTDAEGREKSLLDFTAVDLGAFEARCVLVGNGWFERAKAAKECAKLLAKHNAETVRDLPVSDLEDVAARFQAAFE